MAGLGARRHGLPVKWSDFYVVNALVIVFGIVAANLATHCPGIALAFPALMLINATFFHLLPFARTAGRFSPGLVTAVVLFYPIGIACYWRASHGGTLRTRALIGSLVLGALLMASPIVLLKIKNLRYFRQDRLAGEVRAARLTNVVAELATEG